MKVPRHKAGSHSGLPNGDDAAVYSIPRTAWAWRWEFLRRRDDYRADWAKVHSAWQKQRVRELAHFPLPEGVKSWREHFADIAELPNGLQRQKYGVSCLFNPACEYQPFRFMGIFLTRAEQLRDAARRAAPRGWDGRFEALLAERNAVSDALCKGHILTVYIDLQQALPPQLAHLKTWAAKAQSELAGKPFVSRRRDREWQAYLRALDLERCGSDLDAIAACIFPDTKNDYDADFAGKKSAKAALKQAHRLQETLAVAR